MTEEEIERLFSNEKTATIDVPQGTRIYDKMFETYSIQEVHKMYESYTGQGFDYSLKLDIGDVIKGKLVKQTENDFLFDIGYKDYVRVDNKNEEHRFLANYSDEKGYLSYGTEVEILLTKVTESPFIIRGSVAALSKNNSLNELKTDQGLVIDAKVMEMIPAGFHVMMNYNTFTIPAFMPNALAGANRLSKNQQENLVGQNIKIMIESYSDDRNGFIASRKKYLRKLANEKAKTLQKFDKEGKPKVYTGIVTGTTKSGVFVEFDGCLTGMIHKDCLVDDNKKDLEERKIESGMQISFYVKEIIKGTRLILTQVWRETIWDKAVEGDIYEGVISDIKSIGTLIRLDEETIGLIRSNELERAGIKPSKNVKVKVKISKIHRESHKLFLTLA